MASPLEMYSKFGLAKWIYSANWGKLVRKWPMADCYFKLCKAIGSQLTPKEDVTTTNNDNVTPNSDPQATVLESSKVGTLYW